MSEIDLWQASFNGGEQTPLLEGREDTQKYQTGCRRLRNMHGLIQGPARRRTGTRVAAVTKSNGNAWLVPFIASRDDKYMLELGDNYARFYRDRGQLLKTTTGSGVDDSFTKILLHMDGADASTTFTDESGKVWTAAGNAQIDTASSKFGGASGLFDGTGDFVSTPDHADFDLGAGNWTVDCWFNATGATGLGGNLCGQGDGVPTPAITSFFLGRALTDEMQMRVSDGVTVNTVIGTTKFTNLVNPGWHHIAAIRDGNMLRLFVDGVEEATATFTGPVAASTETFTVGSRSTGGGTTWVGAIDEFRLSVGIARWTESFIPPDGANGTPYEIVTPWTYAQMTDVDGTFKFRLVQNNDVIYVTGGSGIKQINRFSDLNWTITDFDPVGGPFDSANITATTVYASAATGVVTLTASASIFTANHVGALMLLRPQDLSAVPPWEVHQGVATNALRQNDGKTYKMTTAGVTIANGQPVTGTFAISHEEGTEKDGAPDSKCIDPFDNTGQVQAGLDWLFQDPGYGIVKITAAAGTTATATVQPWRTGAVAQLPDNVVLVGKATKRWAFGLFSNANGWPVAGTFFRERLTLGTERKIVFSVPQSFAEFVQETAGQVLADNAFVAEISSDRDEKLKWLLPNGAVLHVGTTGGELACFEQNPNNAFGPTNRKIDPQTGFGSNGAAPLRVGDTPLFVEASGLRVRKIEQTQGGLYSALSQNDLADHITKTTVIQTTYAALPDSLYWGMRADGRLACLTFSKEQDVFGWSLHFLGGWRDASHLQAAKVRSISSIPSPDGTIDDLWMITERTINGGVKRFIEYLTEPTTTPDRWEAESADAHERRIHEYQSGIYFVDGGTIYDNPRAITGVAVSGAGVVTITAPIHGFPNGTQVRLDGLVGPWQLNARSFDVINRTANTFQLDDFDGTGMAAYVSGGFAREMVEALSNLDLWEGETLQVFTDGAVHPDRTVVAGAIALQYKAARVAVGFGYKSILETQRPAGGNSKGSAQGKLGAINQLIIRFEESLGGQVGPNEDALEEILFRTANDEMDLPPPLFSGDKEIAWPDGFSTDRTVVFVQDQPLPSIVKGIGSDMEVSEG